MAASLIVLALFMAAAAATGISAAKYPAGVNPHLCPNYPHCDNVVLTAHNRGHHGAVAPYASSSYATYGHHGAVLHGGGAKYPVGVTPHTCPNYPFCGPTPGHVTRKIAGSHGWAGVNHGLVRHGWDGAYVAPIWRHGVYAAHHGAGARYPASAGPRSCPNYPYCRH